VFVMMYSDIISLRQVDTEVMSKDDRSRWFDCDVHFGGLGPAGENVPKERSSL
jgi:hypothetical protein